MANSTRHKLLIYCIAAVWLVNGLFCKVLNWVPRHKEIVARILGNNYASLLTILIGISEIVMAGWIVSRLWPRFNAVIQIVIITMMNTLEFILVPDLLLWGRANALFAFLFILIIIYSEFGLSKKSVQHN